MRIEKDKVKAFIESRVGVKMYDTTRFFDDLGIDGLDAETLIMDISKEFEVDMSEFNPSKYYSSEYEVGNIFLTLYRAVFDKRKLIKRNFNFEHLYKVIQEGKWVDPF